MDSNIESFSKLILEEFSKVKEVKDKAFERFVVVVAFSLESF
jgi:hypothetical protein